MGETSVFSCPNAEPIQNNNATSDEKSTSQRTRFLPTKLLDNKNKESFKKIAINALYVGGLAVYGIGLYFLLTKGGPDDSTPPYNAPVPNNPQISFTDEDYQNLANVIELTIKTVIVDEIFELAHNDDFARFINEHGIGMMRSKEDKIQMEAFKKILDRASTCASKENLQAIQIPIDKAVMKMAVNSLADNLPHMTFEDLARLILNNMVCCVSHLGFVRSNRPACDACLEIMKKTAPLLPLEIEEMQRKENEEKAKKAAKAAEEERTEANIQEVGPSMYFYLTQNNIKEEDWFKFGTYFDEHGLNPIFCIQDGKIKSRGSYNNGGVTIDRIQTEDDDQKRTLNIYRFNISPTLVNAVGAENVFNYDTYFGRVRADNPNSARNGILKPEFVLRDDGRIYHKASQCRGGNAPTEQENGHGIPVGAIIRLTRFAEGEAKPSIREKYDACSHLENLTEIINSTALFNYEPYFDEDGNFRDIEIPEDPNNSQSPKHKLTLSMDEHNRLVRICFREDQVPVHLINPPLSLRQAAE